MHPVLEAIDSAIDASQDTSHRKHLGASIIGAECSRKLWYGFRWVTAVKWDPRMLRLFERGKLEEERFVKWLENAGVKVYQIDPATNKQYRFTGYKGHFGGEIDGVGVGIMDTPFLLEYKTHGDKSFKTLLSNEEDRGLQAANCTHYVQVQIYMGAMKLDKALYFAINKNTDQIYVEEISFDSDVYESYTARAQMVIDASEPPLRIKNDPSWYECKWCEHHPICHAKAIPLINCRTCAHSTPIENGQWQCEQDRTKVFPIIPEDVIKTGCSKYIRHPME